MKALLFQQSYRNGQTGSSINILVPDAPGGDTTAPELGLVTIHLDPRVREERVVDGGVARGLAGLDAQLLITGGTSS